MGLSVHLDNATHETLCAQHTIITGRKLTVGRDERNEKAAEVKTEHRNTENETHLVEYFLLVSNLKFRCIF